MDGADFNNPFFGEQRGGQRPAFTFNLDAVKEVVVVADGANAEFGRASVGLRERRDEVGHERHPRQRVTASSRARASPRRRRTRGRQPRPRSSTSTSSSAGFTLGGPFVKDKLFFFTAFDYQRGRSTKQTDPNRIDPRSGRSTSRRSARRTRTAPIDRTNDARVFLGKIDWAINEQHLATIRYNYTWSEQKNGTFDVDSWGRQRERRSSRTTRTRWQRLAHLDLLELAPERVPLPVGAGGPAPPVRRARRSPAAAGRFPDTGVDFGRGYRFGDAVLPPGRRLRHAPPVQRQRHVHHGQAHDQGRRRVQPRRTSTQTFRGFANGRIIFDSVDGFLNYARNPKYVECSDGTSNPTGDVPRRARRSPVRSSCTSRTSGVGGPARSTRRARRASIRRSRPSSSRTSGSRSRT